MFAEVVSDSSSYTVQWVWMARSRLSRRSAPVNRRTDRDTNGNGTKLSRCAAQREGCCYEEISYPEDGMMYLYI